MKTRLNETHMHDDCIVCVTAIISHFTWTTCSTLQNNLSNVRQQIILRVTIFVPIGTAARISKTSSCEKVCPQWHTILYHESNTIQPVMTSTILWFYSVNRLWFCTGIYIENIVIQEQNASHGGNQGHTSISKSCFSRVYGSYYKDMTV